MRDYVLAGLAALWLADGIALLAAPRWTIDRVREALNQSPLILRWESFSIVAGLGLAVLGFDLRYRPLWAIVGLSMILKGILLSLGPKRPRETVMQWCLKREEVDYRFWGLTLCILAVLLLHALGWIAPV
jgi:hypothetical protein